jgi:hypothetical protein
MTDSMHDAPLANYPGVIATLVRYKAIKIVKRELQAKGVRIWDVTQRDIVLMAEAYFEANRAELIRVAIDTVRTGADLQRLAESEARRRAKARAALSHKQITQNRPLKSLQSLMPKDRPLVDDGPQSCGDDRSQNEPHDPACPCQELAHCTPPSPE